MRILEELHIASKLIKLVKTILSQTIAKVRTNASETEEFRINKRVKQDGACYQYDINIAMEYITKKQNKENIRKGGAQIITPVDDLVMVQKQKKMLNETFQSVKSKGKHLGMKINVKR